MSTNLMAIIENNHYFLVPKSAAEHIKLEKTAHVVHHEGRNLIVHCPATYRDSEKVADLAMLYRKRFRIGEHRLNPICMEGTLSMRIPDFDENHAAFSFGGFVFIRQDGKLLPVDFENHRFDVKVEDDIVTIDFSFGEYVMPWYLDVYDGAGYSITDISAEMLSGIKGIKGFMCHLDKNEKRYDIQEIADEGFVELRELRFNQFVVPKDVLDEFNDRTNPMLEKSTKYRCMIEFETSDLASFNKMLARNDLIHGTLKTILANVTKVGPFIKAE